MSDPVSAFALSLVQEYLSAHALTGTATALTRETKQKKMDTSDPETWYQLQKDLNVSSLRQRFPKTSKGLNASLLEVLLRHLAMSALRLDGAANRGPDALGEVAVASATPDISALTAQFNKLPPSQARTPSRREPRGTHATVPFQSPVQVTPAVDHSSPVSVAFARERRERAEEARLDSLGTAGGMSHAELADMRNQLAAQERRYQAAVATFKQQERARREHERAQMSAHRSAVEGRARRRGGDDGRAWEGTPAQEQSGAAADAGGGEERGAAESRGFDASREGFPAPRPPGSSSVGRGRRRRAGGRRETAAATEGAPPYPGGDAFPLDSPGPVTSAGDPVLRLSVARSAGRLEGLAAMATRAGALPMSREVQMAAREAAMERRFGDGDLQRSLRRGGVAEMEALMRAESSRGRSARGSGGGRSGGRSGGRGRPRSQRKRGSAVEELSDVSWMPVSQRVRMLRRDIEVCRDNQLATERQRAAAYKQGPPQSALERAKQAEALGGRRGGNCALCELAFPRPSLPLAVTYKAVMDIRESWGAVVPPQPRFAEFPRYYEQVQVCTFCAQYFGTEPVRQPHKHPPGGGPHDPASEAAGRGPPLRQ